MKFSRKDIIEFSVFAAIVLIATVLKDAITKSKDAANFETIVTTTEDSKANSEKYKYTDKFVFLDRVGVLHTSSACKGIKPPQSADTIVIQNLRKYHLNKICSRCISEDQLYELTEITEHHL